MPEQLLTRVVNLNRSHAEEFAAQITARERHYGRHPTNIAVFKCMDGRVNFSHMTGMPRGLVRPFRNIGGVFDLGWAALSMSVEQYVRASREKGRKVLFLATYHFARGDAHRGCRGHNYDTLRAQKSAERLHAQLQRVLDSKDVCSLLVGVETDQQELVFHGQGVSIFASNIRNNHPDEVHATLRELYPDMSEEIVKDLLPLVLGNILHTRKVREARLPLNDLDHKERILAIGHDFEWLPHNTALVIDDLELTMDDTIGKAAGIIGANRDAGRIPNDKALLLASATYEGNELSRKIAIERALYLAQLGQESVAKFHPKLADFFEPVAAVMDWRTRQLELLNRPSL